jgi:molybdopterin-containing oxidoreductase family membrane subunit
VNEYIPTVPELLISLGVWATGFFLVTALFKMAVSVKEEIAE